MQSLNKHQTQVDPIDGDDRRWKALTQRDLQFVGTFYYAVTTTGVYCRPTCASRLPLRENVRFFNSWQEAEQAGFRACKRCQPKDAENPSPHHTAIIAACRSIEQAETPPTLESLAKQAGISPFYFQRLFKKTIGITPRQYFQQERSNRMRESLKQNERVTDAVYAAGFASNSRFYSQAAQTLGMKPSDYQKGGKGMSISYAIVSSNLGWVLVAATPLGICAIDFGESHALLVKHLAQRFPNAHLAPGAAPFSEWVTQVLSLLESPSRGLNLPLDIQGTAFQRRVWLALQAIPCGTTASYTEIATRIGSPKAVRAVASACASNNLAVAIPCHRVVRSNGDLAGYRWGLDRKRKLLELEKESNP
jgi:AraC family transcriptional regulator of adaptative response/methylated-DNA-[protein]-cysteine methyltransferase